MARPGELPLGVLACVELAARNRLFERQPAGEMGDERRRAMRAHDRQGWVELARRERGDLVERAGADHRIEPRIDRGVERGPIRRKEEAGPFARL